MDFSLTDVQAQLSRSLQLFLDRHYGFNARSAASRSESGWRPEIWRAMADELGLLALPLPAADGGWDADPVAVMIVMEALGEALVLEPFLETVVVGCGLLRGCGGETAAAELAEVAAGRSRLAFAWSEPESRFSLVPTATHAARDGDGWRIDGAKTVVTAAPWATRLIVSTATSARGPSLFLIDVDAPGVTLAAYPTIDGRRAADVRLEGVHVGPDRLLGTEGTALPVVESVADAAVAALCAEAVGVMRRLLDDTIAYTKERRQFGQRLADFQVLQHRMADMYMQLEMAASAAHLATLKLSASAGERARAASAAKVTIGRASRFIGQSAVQLHGGMGMTDELAVSQYFKRGLVIETEFGTADHHLNRYARLSEAA